ncbi:MAG: hypothetical protein ABH879_10410 [archaeon]
MSKPLYNLSLMIRDNADMPVSVLTHYRRSLDFAGYLNGIWCVDSDGIMLPQFMPTLDRPLTAEFTVRDNVMALRRLDQMVDGIYPSVDDLRSGDVGDIGWEVLATEHLSDDVLKYSAGWTHHILYDGMFFWIPEVRDRHLRGEFRLSPQLQQLREFAEVHYDGQMPGADVDTASEDAVAAYAADLYSQNRGNLHLRQAVSAAIRYGQKTDKKRPAVIQISDRGLRSVMACHLEKNGIHLRLLGAGPVIRPERSQRVQGLGNDAGNRDRAGDKMPWPRDIFE